ncbi:MAG: purine nucleoside permease [Pseudomonadota bacterium]
MPNRISQVVATCASLVLLAACSEAPSGSATVPQTSATDSDTTYLDCEVAAPCATPFAVKLVIVTMFERGEDEGDAPGEFQFWKERFPLNTRVAMPQAHHDVFVNEEQGVVGIVTGIGTMHSAASTMAIGLDPRFDFSEAYWLVAGIAGIDPEDASIGSAIWSAYLVDGDLSHEIDAREKPHDWDTGYFARHTKFPGDPERPHPKGEVFKINEGLRDWAYTLTKDIVLDDSDGIAKARSAYTEHPNAQRPPFVGKGGHIAAMTFWHGALLNQWANDWVSYWSGGETDFVTSAMEETGTFQAITYLDRIGKVDKERFMVLRAGSNYTMPPPGVSAAENLLKENEGYAGMLAALEALYKVGSVVIEEITGNWSVYAEQIPGNSDVRSGMPGQER